MKWEANMKLSFDNFLKQLLTIQYHNKKQRFNVFWSHQILRTNHNMEGIRLTTMRKKEYVRFGIQRLIIVYLVYGSIVCNDKKRELILEQNKPSKV